MLAVKNATDSKEQIREKLKNLNQKIDEAKNQRNNFGPETKADWIRYGKKCVKPGIYYARTRFVDVEHTPYKQGGL